MKTLTGLDALEYVIKTHFNGNITAFARAIELSPNSIHNWRTRGQVATEQCPVIERVSRERAKDDSQVVLCEQLRPLVEWDVLRKNPLFSEAQAKKAALAVRSAKRKLKQETANG